MVDRVEAGADNASRRSKSDRVESYGALVGWKSDDLHDKLVLRMQIVHKPPPHTREDVQHSVLVLDKNQAVQLATYLFQVTGQTMPKPRSSRLSRLFGK